MISYNIIINNGNENIGIDKKTITVQEKVKNAEQKDVAEEINHLNPLIAELSADTVLTSYLPAIILLFGRGNAIQYRNRNGDVVMRIIPDLEIKDGSIDLEKAQKLIPGTTDLTVENARQLVAAAGLSLKIRVETYSKFTEMLGDDINFQLENIIERAKVTKKDNESSSKTVDTSTGTTVDTSTGGNPGGGDDIPDGNG